MAKSAQRPTNSRFDIDILGPHAQYEIQEAIVKNLGWYDVRNLQKSSRNLEQDQVLTQLEDGDAANRGWMIPTCMHPTHETREGFPEH